MRYSTQVRPISWLKANAAEALETLADKREPYLITQNGEAKAVLVDLASYEQQQETLALLKLLVLAERDVEEGRVEAAGQVVAELRAELDAEFPASPHAEPDGPRPRKRQTAAKAAAKRNARR